jgi:hypothetical protein
MARIKPSVLSAWSVVNPDRERGAQNQIMFRPGHVDGGGFGLLPRVMRWMGTMAVAMLVAGEVWSQEPPVVAEGSTLPVAAGEGAPFVVRPVESTLELQVELHRRGFSCGSIDGVAGGQTTSALRAFQRGAGLA